MVNNPGCGSLPDVHNMGIHGQKWLHRQLMELAAVVLSCWLQSDDRMMLLSGTSNNHDLDLDWQSMSVHYEAQRDQQRDTETDTKQHARACMCALTSPSVISWRCPLIHLTLWSNVTPIHCTDFFFFLYLANTHTFFFSHTQTAPTTLLFPYLVAWS